MFVKSLAGSGNEYRVVLMRITSEGKLKAHLVKMDADEEIDAGDIVRFESNRIVIEGAPDEVIQAVLPFI